MPESSLRAAEVLGTSSTVTLSILNKICAVPAIDMSCSLAGKEENQEKLLEIFFSTETYHGVREVMKDADGLQMRPCAETLDGVGAESVNGVWRILRALQT